MNSPVSAVSRLQTAEGLPGHAGPAGGDHRGLLEDAVGAQLHHRGHAHQAAGNGPGKTHSTHRNMSARCPEKSQQPSTLFKY